MSINRVVVLISPIFVGLAGWIVQWIGVHLPGHPHLNATDVTALFVAGALFAAAHVAQWLHGRQKWELQQTAIAHEKSKA